MVVPPYCVLWKEALPDPYELLVVGLHDVVLPLQRGRTCPLKHLSQELAPIAICQRLGRFVVLDTLRLRGVRGALLRLPLLLRHLDLQLLQRKLHVRDLFRARRTLCRLPGLVRSPHLLVRLLRRRGYRGAHQHLHVIEREGPTRNGTARWGRARTRARSGARICLFRARDRRARRRGWVAGARGRAVGVRVVLRRCVRAAFLTHVRFFLGSPVGARCEHAPTGEKSLPPDRARAGGLLLGYLLYNVSMS